MMPVGPVVLFQFCVSKVANFVQQENIKKNVVSMPYNQSNCCIFLCVAEF